MILISHRGNIEGPDTAWENKPAYINAALSKGFDVELDVWFIEGNWILGHDAPRDEVDLNFLSRSGLWIHCKNYVTLKQMTKVGQGLNYFYHTTEDYVLTSKKYIWAYPSRPGGENTICVMPEWFHTPHQGFAGVCSDYIESYK